MLTDQDIKNLIRALNPQFDSINERFDGLEESVNELQETVNGLEETVNGLEETVDNLAMMTKKGFDKTVTSADFNEFEAYTNAFIKETTESLFSIDGKVKDSDTRLKQIEEMLKPMFVGYDILQKEVRDLNKRVARIEKKEGIVI